MKITDWNALEKYRRLSKPDYDALLSTLHLVPGRLSEAVCPSCTCNFLFAPPHHGFRCEAICACPYGCGYWGSYPEFFSLATDTIDPGAYDTAVVCATCSAEYAIRGVAAFCPHCVIFNSRQALLERLAQLRSELTAPQREPKQTERLVDRVLSDAVSVFDGYGRTTLRGSILGANISTLSFQSLTGARKNLLERASYDLAAGVTPPEWEHAVRCFQKRHLLAHNWGVVDERYLRETGDVDAKVGRKVKITVAEVERLLDVLTRIALHYYGHIAS